VEGGVGESCCSCSYALHTFIHSFWD
jgi:hypothetical protein